MLQISSALEQQKRLIIHRTQIRRRTGQIQSLRMPRICRNTRQTIRLTGIPRKPPVNIRRRQIQQRPNFPVCRTLLQNRHIRCTQFLGIIKHKIRTIQSLPLQILHRPLTRQIQKNRQTIHLRHPVQTAERSIPGIIIRKHIQGNSLSSVHTQIYNIHLYKPPIGQSHAILSCSRLSHYVPSPFANLTIRSCLESLRASRQLPSHVFASHHLRACSQKQRFRNQTEENTENTKRKRK